MKNTRPVGQLARLESIIYTDSTETGKGWYVKAVQETDRVTFLVCQNRYGQDWPQEAFVGYTRPRNADLFTISEAMFNAVHSVQTNSEGPFAEPTVSIVRQQTEIRFKNALNDLEATL